MSVHPGSIWIDNNVGQAPQDIWVAVNATGVVAEHTDLTLLMEYLSRQVYPLVLLCQNDEFPREFASDHL